MIVAILSMGRRGIDGKGCGEEVIISTGDTAKIDAGLVLLRGFEELEYQSLLPYLPLCKRVHSARWSF